MKKFGKQSKEITLERLDGDIFTFTLEVGIYYIDNVDTGIFINTADTTIFFESFDEYWKTNLETDFWEDILCETTHEPITPVEAAVLSQVVEELRKEVYTGVNQLYINDETWIVGVFEIVY